MFDMTKQFLQENGYHVVHVHSDDPTVRNAVVAGMTEKGYHMYGMSVIDKTIQYTFVDMAKASELREMHDASCRNSLGGLVQDNPNGLVARLISGLRLTGKRKPPSARTEPELGLRDTQHYPPHHLAAQLLDSSTTVVAEDQSREFSGQRRRKESEVDSSVLGQANLHPIVGEAPGGSRTSMIPDACAPSSARAARFDADDAPSSRYTPASYDPPSERSSSSGWGGSSDSSSSSGDSGGGGGGCD